MPWPWQDTPTLRFRRWVGGATFKEYVRKRNERTSVFLQWNVTRHETKVWICPCFSGNAFTDITDACVLTNTEYLTPLPNVVM